MTQGQVAIEYMILVAVLIAVIAPIIYVYNTSISALGSSVGVENVVNTLFLTMEKVHSQGYPASEIVRISIPEQIIANRTYIANQTLQVAYYGKTGGITDVFRSFDYDVVGEIPTRTGAHVLRVSTFSNGTLLVEELTFYAEPKRVSVLVSDSGYKHVNITVFNVGSTSITINATILGVENRVDLNASTVINENQTSALLSPNANSVLPLNISTAGVRGTFFGQVLLESELGTVAIPITIESYITPLLLAWRVGTQAEFDAGTYDMAFFNTSANGVTVDETRIYEEEVLTAADIVADVYVRSSQEYESQTRVNISDIPKNRTFENATFCLYINLVSGTVDNDVRVSRVADQSWLETITTTNYNAQSVTNISVTTLNSTAQDTWTCMNVTYILKTDYELNNTFSSIRFDDPDYSFTTAGSIFNDRNLRIGGRTGGGNYLNFRSRTETDSSLRPYFVVATSYIPMQGSYESEEFEANNTYSWHNITLNTPSVNVQARTTNNNATWPSYTGPDGTSSSYYTSGDALNLSAGVYFQFRMLNMGVGQSVTWVNVSYGE